MEASHDVGDDIEWVKFINWSLCLVNYFVDKLWKMSMLLMRLNAGLA